MKLVLGNNQSVRFVSFYKDLQSKADLRFDYTDYQSLLFLFDVKSDQPTLAYNLSAERSFKDYDGILINNYVNTYELAATVSIVADSMGIAYENREFSNPLSMSKLSETAKLAAARVAVPASIGGAKVAILHSRSKQYLSNFPYVLKRADADRGIDNFLVKDITMIEPLLEGHDDRSIWILQEFVPNDGYFRIAYNGGKPQYAIFRTLETRPDGNELKAHMYRPKGGSNAELVELKDVPQSVVEMSRKAVSAMNRQFAGVDCLYDKKTESATIIEVNYNPQLVTVESFSDIRQEAFLEGLKNIKN